MGRAKVQQTGDIFQDKIAQREDNKRRVRNSQLKNLACVMYLTNPSWSLESLPSRDRRLLGVSAEQLRRWAIADSWDVKRKDVEEAHFAKLRTHLANQYSQERLEEAQQLLEAKNKAQAYISQEAVAPRSFEGLVKARLALGSRVEELHAAMAGEIMKVADPLADLELSPEEQQAVAKFLLDMRRNQAEAQAAAEVEAAEERLQLPAPTTEAQEAVASEPSEDEEFDGEIELEADSGFLEDLDQIERDGGIGG